MTSFEELKKAHNAKLEQVLKLSQRLSINIVKRDLEQLASELSERLKKTGAHYTLDEAIYLSIDDKASLEIEDRRGDAFLWGFEVDYLDELRLGDLFEHDGKIYSAQSLRESSFNGAETVLRQIVDTLDDTLTKLRNRTELDQWTYRYYSAHENIFCDTIRDVINTVLKRKP